jgi:hypothetical protein
MLPYRSVVDGNSHRKPVALMVRPFTVAVVVVSIALLTWACGAPPAPEPAGPATRDPRPVSGRVSTRAGISVEFPAGWAEVPLHGPFTRSFENKETQLNLDLSDFTPSGDSLPVLGQRMHQDLAHEGTVVESGTTTVDGRDAYRVLLEKRTSSGHGLVYGLIVPRPSGRVTTVFLSSRGDETPRQRADIDAIVATIRVEP